MGRQDQGGKFRVKASEYVRELNKLVKEHGDLELMDSFDEPLSVPEYYEDSDSEPCFVAADKA